MTEERINLLASKWRKGTLNPNEKAEFEQWYASFDDTSHPLLRPETMEVLGERIYRSIQDQKEVVHREESTRQSSPAPGKKGAPWRMAAAIAALLALTTSALFLFRPLFQPQQARLSEKPVKVDILPGGNKATLTLADGRSIALDSSRSELLPGTRGISMPEQGLLAYSGGDQKVSYNTLSTPRGGQFRLKLPDGTHVWLNAASSITYPTVFKGKERKVSLQGEAYFEVAPDKTRPFKVSSSTKDGREQVVEVLGTHFNINAYADEPAVKTTLLEGSVEVQVFNEEAAQKPLRLKPGQQAVLNQRQFRVRPVNTEEIVAWKNGLFQFKNASLSAVLRQLARWYDVNIVYKGSRPDRRFSGKIYRNITASEALDILRFTKVNFEIVAPSAGGEKKIIVSP